MLKDRIKELRTNADLTIKAFADSIGVSGPAVSNYESGKKKPGDKTLQKIAEAYNVSKEWLTGDPEEIRETAEMVKKAVEIAAPVVAEEIADQTAAAERKVVRKVKETAIHAAPEVVIESLLGGQITVEEILKRVPEDAEKIYVKPEENKAFYSTKNGEGSVDLWE